MHIKLSFIITTISIIITSSILSLTIPNLKYKYDACNPAWGNDTLWLNLFLGTESTICNDKEI